jgi:hypothetical protein
VKLIAIYIVILAVVIGVIHSSINAWDRKGLPSTNASVSTAPKITGITRDFVYDLSGSEAGGIGDAMRLFDEHCDPKHDPSFHPATNPLPTVGAAKFFKGDGVRIVVDLQAQYDLKEVYWYDKALKSDSVWFYTGDMHHWTQAVAYETTGMQAGWGWKTFALHSSSRYIMIRFRSEESVLAEMVLYGNMIRKEPATMSTALATKQPTLREFAGTNSFSFVDTKLMQPFHDIRMYQLLSWYDTDTLNDYPANRMSLPFPMKEYADSIQRQGGNLWLSIRGVPAWMDKKGFNERDKPVTKVGMNASDPLSYGRHARTYWNLAAMFGKTPVDTAAIDLRDATKFSGLGAMRRFENGNEEDGWWTDYYWTPVDYFAMSSADYDGHEGTLGDRHGIKNADSSSLLMMSGMVQLDTNRVRTLKFLCEQLRRDKKFIWDGGVQYHYYSTDSKNVAQFPTKGVSPEEDRVREKLAKVKAFHNRILPGVPVILGENGYDRNQQSRQRAPLLPGYNESQSQGVMVIRALMAAFMSGFDGFNQYMMRDATEDPNATGPYATSGMVGGPNGQTILPLWYYWSTTVNILGNYKPALIVSESGNVWVYKFQHATEKNSVAYYLVSPTINGTTIKNFKLTVSAAAGHPVQQIRLADKSVTGSVANSKTGNGFVEVEVGESPVILLMKAN